MDITHHAKQVVVRSWVNGGLVALYAQGATGAIIIQENWDHSVRTDVIQYLRAPVPRLDWIHHQQDGNGDAHVRTGVDGPAETIPITDGEDGLSRWQNIFFCEFDRPRTERAAVCAGLSDHQ